MKEGLEKDVKKFDSTGVKDGEITTEPPKKKGKEERPPTKVVVRRLPPSMTEEEFLQQVDPLPPVDYMYYVPADMSLTPNCFCRAYLNFINQNDIFIFTQKFDNYVFVDSKGVEYPAVVEFAPFQRIPKQRPGRKKDLKCGTLESDPVFALFLEKLQSETQETVTAGNNMKQHFFETNVGTSDENKINSTPLLDFLRTRHLERRRLREEKRKKDLERKRAKDELRRNAKKPDDEAPVVKVLHSQTVNKDKLKDEKGNSKLATKKRSEERLKEYKGRSGKSYQEERQKQLERREEQKKKLGSGATLSKSKLTGDKKPESLKGADLDTGQDTKKSEKDSKKEGTNTEKGSVHPSKTYGHSQKYQDSAKRDEERRRIREERALKRKEERERREERYRNNKKTTTVENKRTNDRYDRYKERSSSYRKSQNTVCNGTEKKVEKENRDPKKTTSDSVTESKEEEKTESLEVPAKNKNEEEEDEEDMIVDESNIDSSKDAKCDDGTGDIDDDDDDDGIVLEEEDDDDNDDDDDVDDDDPNDEDEVADDEDGDDCDDNEPISVDACEEATKEPTSIEEDCEETTKGVADSNAEGDDETVDGEENTSTEVVKNDKIESEDLCKKSSQKNQESSELNKNDEEWKKLGAKPNDFLNIEESPENGATQRRNSMESGDGQRNKGNVDKMNTMEQRRNSIGSDSSVVVSQTQKEEQRRIKDFESIEESKVTDVDMNSTVNISNKQPEKNIVEESKENTKPLMDGASENQNIDKKNEEVVLKRRNSLEMYDDCKGEKNEKQKRRESGRRNSLESGEKNVTKVNFEEKKLIEKIAAGDSDDKTNDPRTKRRIRNKDRPSIEIYRPGMGRFSKQRLEREKVGSSTEVDSPSPSPSPTPIPKHRQPQLGYQGRETS